MTNPDVTRAAGDAALVAEAEATAEGLLRRSAALESRSERRRRRRVATVVADGPSREFLAQLTDEVLRIHTAPRAARRLRDLLADLGVPAFATGADRAALVVGARLAASLPQLVMPLAGWRLRRELSGIVLPAGPAALSRHARRRTAQGVRLNFNLLGEAVLGDAEAQARTDAVVGLLGRRDVDYVSVKISSICAQLDVLAYADSLGRIQDALRSVYRAAASPATPKFVNLDMEEYRDLDLTVDAFVSVLSEPEFADLYAGIVLQAYLPDSVAALERIAAFARERHARHGSAVKVRIVKGANLAMEGVEAELRGWEQAPYTDKGEVDANYKRLLDLALEPTNEGALRVGVASHNLFDIGWALARRAAGAGDRLEIEMLEGMANPQALAVREVAGDLLLYAPIVRRCDFESAVAYLVRRFDENSAPENFLSHLFDLAPTSPAWEAERQRFRVAVAERLTPARSRRRRQDRATEEGAPSSATARPVAFCNEPDTDFSLAANREWLSTHLAQWSPPASEIPAVVDGEEVRSPATGRGVDPSSPGTPLYRYVEVDRDTVERAVACAVGAGKAWRSLEPAKRREVLVSAGAALARGRGALLVSMARDAGKTFGEGDVEVSEAVDYARFCGNQAVEVANEHAGAAFEPHAVVVVAPPWNFPLAIPAGGVFAALAAGSAVILKPAPESVLTAWHLASLCWEAGIPRHVLQFVPAADDDVGRRLISHPDVDAVILTGAFETARRFLEWRPSMTLHAETSGKNALVITAAADQDYAIADLVRSAFSHAGQKCSAASLAIVEGPVYDDPKFRARLADIVGSLRVGPATDPATQVGPLIAPPTGKLARALRELAPGERWLVQPRQVGDNPHLWRPGVKLGVRPGSEFHLTEYFGPVLGLMRAGDLGEAIALQNAPPFGLTGGIHTLDWREIDRWLDGVAVGNAYVNRHITGAVVRRQPFGGWKRSTVGPGAKAGGPHYVASLGRWRRVLPADVGGEVEKARARWQLLSDGVDPSGLRAEANIFRLRPLATVSMRIEGTPDPVALAVALGVADLLGVRLDVSLEDQLPGVPPGAHVEGSAGFLERLASCPAERARLVGTDPALRLAVMDLGVDADVEPLVAIGEIELLRWTREQAVSATLHRHGNVRRRPGPDGSWSTRAR